MVSVRRDPHLTQDEEPALYDAARNLIGDSLLVLAGWESEQVDTYLERPGDAVAASLDAVVDGTYSDYWPAMDRDSAKFWFGTADQYNPADRFQFTLSADNSDTRYHVYGDFNYASNEHKERLGDLVEDSPDFTTASNLPRRVKR